MDNATIKLFKSLSQKKFRDEYGLFVVEGEKLVEELLQSDFVTKKIVYTNRFSYPPVDGVRGEYEQISEPVMERISAFKTPPPVLAVAEIPKARPLPVIDKNELYLALDTIQDPGNLGTIIRIADWFGIRHIICSPETADCYNPKVVQATMGAIFRVQVHYTDLAAFLQQTKHLVPVYGTFLDGENMYSKTLTAGGIIVMGNEGNGISASIEKNVTERLYIPPFPANVINSESLNAAVSAAIVCAEFRRCAYSM